MKRRMRLDDIEWDRLVQCDASGEIPRDDERVNAVRAEDPQAWDRVCDAYRRVDRLLKEAYEEPLPLPKRSPLRGALDSLEEKERVRAVVRRVYDQRLVAMGFQNAVVRATQSLARGLVGISLTARGVGRILGTFNTTINVVVLNRLSELPRLLGADRTVIDITPKSTEEEPA